MDQPDGLKVAEDKKEEEEVVGKELAKKWPKSDPIGKANVGEKIGLRGGFANFGAIEKRKRGG